MCALLRHLSQISSAKVLCIHQGLITKHSLKLCLHLNQLLCIQRRRYSPLVLLMQCMHAVPQHHAIIASGCIERQSF